MKANYPEIFFYTTLALLVLLVIYYCGLTYQAGFFHGMNTANAKMPRPTGKVVPFPGSKPPGGAA